MRNDYSRAPFVWIRVKENSSPVDRANESAQSLHRVGVHHDQRGLRSRRFVHDVPLPDTGSLERDLVEAFQRRVSFKDRVEGQAWARLLAEKHDRGRRRHRRRREGAERRLVDAWNARSPGRLKPELLEAAVRTIVSGARSGSLVRGSARSSKRDVQVRVERATHRRVR